MSLDAGEPVRGARVQAAGRTVVTTASGTAHVFLPDGRRKVTATATRAGYVGASIRFTCCP